MILYFKRYKTSKIYRKKVVDLLKFGKQTLYDKYCEEKSSKPPCNGIH